MKKNIIILAIILLTGQSGLFSQIVSDTSVYLITCGPGTETYSHYGHSALRVTIPDRNIDLVYNWGVFDFSTPHFAYKFAKGRLEYLLDTENFKRFLQTYYHEQRWVQVQKINLTASETRMLMELIAENLKPENLKYRYDFFYDDCSTRIRDLLEKVLGNKLKYSPSGDKVQPDFRFLVGTYQLQYQWLDFGIDLLMGTPSNKKASDRDRMFLPVELKKGLSEAYVTREGRLVPLLRNPETVIDFSDPVIKRSFVFEPFFIFTLLCVAMIIFTSAVREGKAPRMADIILFSLFSCLSLLLLFTNFITDHLQMKYNLSLIWLSPFVISCLVALILNKKGIVWFRIVFFLSIVSFTIQLILPSTGNNAFLPLILILLMRSSVRSGFSWNPLSLKTI